MHVAKENSGKPQTFEESVAQLEQIVAAIESGQIGLEESLAKYEQGMDLVKKCRSILDRAEKRIEQLTQTAEGGGGLSAEPLDPKQVLGGEGAAR
ncbi:MAG TPA: exodeoxyribonuclease VII small subunit [Phycisphaerae bacterium]|nr:exodeoxyribonuclease VII small subunit [Phycisphaerae bacterium]